MELVIAGVDEAGRGPLAGPVYAAAVILHPTKIIAGLTDSKLLTEKQRNALSGEIKEKAIAWSLGHADVLEIETVNILQATMLAMQRAVAGLKVNPHKVLIDGNHCPIIPYPAEAIIGGDFTVPVISAASILAKVARDAEMIKWDAHYPGYGFAQHKGYATKGHREALKKLGPTPLHRKNFTPVKELIDTP